MYQACEEEEIFMDTQHLYQNRSSHYYWDKPVTPSWKDHFSLPQSVHKMLSRWVRKPRPTSDTEH